MVIRELNPKSELSCELTLQPKLQPLLHKGTNYENSLSLGWSWCVSGVRA